MAYNADTMSFDLPDTDTVYVSGLPTNITERDVEEFFGSIGKYHRILRNAVPIHTASAGRNQLTSSIAATLCTSARL